MKFGEVITTTNGLHFRRNCTTDTGTENATENSNRRQTGSATQQMTLHIYSIKVRHAVSCTAGESIKHMRRGRHHKTGRGL